MVRVLKDSYCSPDARTREQSISWLRERTTPAAFQVLYRAKNDPTAVVRAEAMLGLSEIAPEYQLDAFQMRNIEPAERAELIQRAANEGQIDAVSLRSIATDSSASAIERAQAMQELSRLGIHVSAEAWVPLLGVDDERTQLVAALSVVTSVPLSRSVALAQDHAINALRKSVVDASTGNITAVIGALRSARRSPTQPLADWASALMNACSDLESPEQQLVWREAIRTLLIVDPTRPGLEQQWNRAWTQAKHNSGDETTLTFWAFEAASIRQDETIQTPAWLVARIKDAGADEGSLRGLIAKNLESMSRGLGCDADLLVATIEAGSSRIREHTLEILFALPKDRCSPALVSLLEKAEISKLEPWFVRAVARELAVLDLDMAKTQLNAANTRGDEDIAIAFVLAGVWSNQVSQNRRLSWMRSLCEAERMIEGPRSQDRARLADELADIADKAGGFSLPIRAEAAWLAIMLRDQTSEAIAHLPRRQNSLPGDLSPEGEQADSPLQWAQMQYP
jgi:hypothetical protein